MKWIAVGLLCVRNKLKGHEELKYKAETRTFDIREKGFSNSTSNLNPFADDYHRKRLVGFCILSERHPDWSVAVSYGSAEHNDAYRQKINDEFVFCLKGKQRFNSPKKTPKGNNLGLLKGHHRADDLCCLPETVSPTNQRQHSPVAESAFLVLVLRIVPTFGVLTPQVSKQAHHPMDNVVKISPGTYQYMVGGYT